MKEANLCAKLRLRIKFWAHHCVHYTCVYSVCSCNIAYAGQPNAPSEDHLQLSVCEGKTGTLCIILAIGFACVSSAVYYKP